MAEEFEFGDVFSTDDVWSIWLSRRFFPTNKVNCRGNKIHYDTANRSHSDLDLVTTSGSHGKAVLLSDSCEIESVIKRRRQGNLLFAPVRAIAPGSDASRSLRTCAITLQGGPHEVEFSKMFSVEGRLVSDLPVYFRLAEPDIVRLEAQLSGYTLRRSPEVEVAPFAVDFGVGGQAA